ncbi:prepilin peptidase [Pseudorhodobacter sp.]|uniref:prepilin peptidase n=1 Tax=Pseudorhodobacter sp. TaxID=1934400 RepID=UPI0026481C4C|nr:prepilin peptidase [Pseudorhodobacter sp.]MDN5788101.1 prepilin peptidase [Pseudorhodobacter sp.]
MGTLPQSLLWFLPFTVPIAIWVAWSDMKFMKIPNKAVIALLLVYLLVGLFVFPLKLWLWGWALFAVILAIGFLATAAGLMGGGDAKFAAAMAPFFVTADPRTVLLLLASCILAAVVSHRMLKRASAFRAVTPDWESWTHKDFPMGLALAGALVFYPILALLLP